MARKKIEENFETVVDEKQCLHGKNIETCETYRIVGGFNPPIVTDPCDGCIPEQKN